LPVENDFTEFWAAYPKKVAKLDAQKAWNKLTPEDRFAAVQALSIHVRYWQIAGTAKEFMPHGATWLHGRRWEDELEMPAATNGHDWMKTQTGIAAKAREVGITPRVGEGWMELKARVLGAMKAA
jgi:hypothetical protein